jgi:hypothetical protein
VTGETSELLALGRAVRRDGERVRELAARVRSVADIEWRSPAADAFRGRVDDRVRGLLRAASLAEAAARALEEHAAACEAHLAAVGLAGS